METFWVHEKEGDLMIDRQEFVPRRGRLYNRRLVIIDGRRKEKPFSLQLYNATEIERMLEEVGMKVLQMYGSWKGEILKKDSTRIITVARAMK